MGDLTRKDIWQTVGHAVSAWALAIGVVGIAIAWYFSLVMEVKAQQQKLDEQAMQMWQLTAQISELTDRVDTLLMQQAQFNKFFEEWLKQQQAATQ